MRNWRRRLLAGLVAAVMAAGMLPATALAAEEGGGPGAPGCICDTLCTADDLSLGCPVCGAEGAGLSVCLGAAPEPDPEDTPPPAVEPDPDPPMPVPLAAGDTGDFIVTIVTGDPESCQYDETDRILTITQNGTYDISMNGESLTTDKIVIQSG